MIDIILLAEQYSTEYTLASLMKKSDNYRVHLFVRPKLYNQYKSEIQWALENIRELYVYQTPFDNKTDPNKMAMVLNQFKEHWKDKQPKGFPIERVIASTEGCRLFLGSLVNDIPTVAQMGNKVAYFAREYKYCNHPQYQNYYGTIGITEYNSKNVDPNFVLLNWTKFKEVMHDQYLWFPKGTATRRQGLSDKDAYILSSRNSAFFPRIRSDAYPWGYMPLYFDGQIDKLIKLEAVGAKDCVNYNVMMRKSFSICVPIHELSQPYELVPTLWGMAIPYDCWTSVIDEIPMNIRKQALNESILNKATKQKKHLRKVVEASYLLGKV